MMLPSISNQTFSVSENAISNSIVGNIQATDDIGVTAFGILSGNVGNAFAVNNAGLLISIGNIDYEMTSNYSLDIQVSDADGKVTNATITVNVSNIEDENPIISNKTFTVSENVSNNTIVGTIAATDDVGIAFYAIIGGNIRNAFDISIDGKVTTTTRLNHDDISSYNLLVLVADMVGNNAIAIITVSITDVDADPAVTTRGASPLQNNSVTLTGEITDLGTNSNGNNQVNEYGFVYSLTASQIDDLQIGKIGVERVGGANLTNTGAYNFAIANLNLSCTDYHYRAFAANDSGISYGEVREFSTSDQAFTLSGVGNGEQTNTLCAGGTHIYTVPLSHQEVYSLTVKAASQVLSNIAVYESTNAEPLYIRAGPFASGISNVFTNINGGITNIYSNLATFPGVNGGIRYMVLPLAAGAHQLVISNSNEESQVYSLNLETYQGINPATLRLRTAPDKTGYFDSPDDPRHFWVHLPANKNLQIELDGIRGNSNGFIIFSQTITSDPDLSFSSSSSNDTRVLVSAINFPSYFVLRARDGLGPSANSRLNTNFRFVFHFVD